MALFMFSSVSMNKELLAAFAFGWYLFIQVVCTIGIFRIWSRYSSRPPTPISCSLPSKAVPHVTVIRPVKGIEPCMYDCLAATFRQTYPTSKLTVFFCVSSRDDPAVPILKQLLSDFHEYDAHMLVEEEDPNLSGRDGDPYNLGPNPKIRNMSRAYREAKGDIIWIIDCNVWVDKTVVARMVDLLCGLGPGNHGTKYKFVHQLPLSIDVSDLSDPPCVPSQLHPLSDAANFSVTSSPAYFGGLLEQMFLSTSHAKFYNAISAVAVAPCTVGKSNMFRRSHLNALTASTSYRDPGIDYFSENICEDHLIGDLLWKTSVPNGIRIAAEKEGHNADSSSSWSNSSTTQWRNHGLLSHSFAIQPTSYLPLTAYLARRTRWLRVRKFTVPLATFVEHGTESLFCSFYGALGCTTLPWCNERLGIPQTWLAFFVLWASSIILWCLVDVQVSGLLQRSGALDADTEVPFWISRKKPRKGTEWLRSWVGREIFAFPIWLWAVVGGVTVIWRGRRFWVGIDMKVHEIDAKGTESNEDMGIAPSTDGTKNALSLRGRALRVNKGRID